MTLKTPAPKTATKDYQGKSHEHVEHTLEDQVEPAAEIGAGNSQNQADRAAHESGAETDDQRRTRAEDQSREDVAAELVGAQQVQPARRLHHRAEVVLLRIVGRDPSGQSAGGKHDQNDREADGTERLPAEEIERDAQRRPLELGRLVGRAAAGGGVRQDDRHGGRPFTRNGCAGRARHKAGRPRDW
jgi:hypothetical protein